MLKGVSLCTTQAYEVELISCCSSSHRQTPLVYMNSDNPGVEPSRDVVSDPNASQKFQEKLLQALESVLNKLSDLYVAPILYCTRFLTASYRNQQMNSHQEKWEGRLESALEQFSALQADVDSISLSLKQAHRKEVSCFFLARVIILMDHRALTAPKSKHARQIWKLPSCPGAI